MLRMLFFFFKQKTAYEMRISDWSSDVCSSDLSCDASGEPMKGAQQMDVDDRDALILPVPPEPFALILGPAMRGASSDAIETSLRHMGLLPERIGDADRKSTRLNSSH